MARTGTKSTQLRTVARLDRFVVPAGGDILTHDLVFGVAAGHPSEEVLAGYRKEALTEKQMTGLRVGQRVFFGGYPAYQPKYEPFTQEQQFERQSFVAKVLALGLLRVPLQSIFVTAVQSLWVSSTDTTDGATSSYGVSGAVGMVRLHGKIASVVVTGRRSDTLTATLIATIGNAVFYALISFWLIRADALSNGRIGRYFLDSWRNIALHSSRVRPRPSVGSMSVNADYKS